MKFSQFGSDIGKTVIYFHGAPGAPEECAIFDLYAKERGLTFICFDRFSGDYSTAGDAYYQFLARQISKQAAGKKVDVIGFSIGAFIALQTCRYLGNGVRSLHLISAAAPLDAGGFLDDMAGKRVFQLAKTAPTLFVLLSYWQGLLALLFPNTLFRLLFASAAGDDKALSVDREFQSGITQVLRACFIGRSKATLETSGLMSSPGKTRFPASASIRTSGTEQRITGRRSLWRNIWHRRFPAAPQPKFLTGCRITHASIGRRLKYAVSWVRSLMTCVHGPSLQQH